MEIKTKINTNKNGQHYVRCVGKHVHVVPARHCELFSDLQKSVSKV
jgi:hypothetical protein